MTWFTSRSRCRDSVQCDQCGIVLNDMKIVCLLTVGLLVPAIVLSKDEVASGYVKLTQPAVHCLKPCNHVLRASQRIPRALVLQPVMKVKEEDDGPFDFISNWLSQMFRQPKTIAARQVPQMLGPIRVPGLDNQVYIKQVEPTSNVMIRVQTRDNQMPMTMTYYPMMNARPAPMSSGGFAPMSSPSWARPYQSHQQSQFMPSPTMLPVNVPYRNNYSNQQNDFRSRPADYSNNFRAHPQFYRPQYQPPTYRPTYDAAGYDQNQYAAYDYRNTISGTASSNYHPARPVVNYQSSYSAGLEPQDSESSEEKPLASKEDESESEEESYEVAEISPTEATVYSASPNEIVRNDRMVPTVSTKKNKLSTRTSKSLSKFSTTRRPRKSKYSQRGIQEIPAPDMKVLKESMEQLSEENEDVEVKAQDTDSRMDEDGILLKDGTTLGKGESLEHIDKEDRLIMRAVDVMKKAKVPKRNLSSNRGDWKPINARSTEATVEKKTDGMEKPSDKIHLDMTNKSVRNSTRDENATPEVLKKVMNLTAKHSWRPQETKKAKRKVGSSTKNRRVRVVKSVRSSVSMTSSRGSTKSKEKT